MHSQYEPDRKSNLESTSKHQGILYTKTCSFKNLWPKVRSMYYTQVITVNK